MLGFDVDLRKSGANTCAFKRFPDAAHLQEILKNADPDEISSP